MTANSQWWSDLERETWTKFNGLDQSVSNEDSLKEGLTDQADGFSFHGNELRTDFWGMSSLHFNLTRGEYRCYGLVPAIDKGYFYSVFGQKNSSSMTSNRDYNSMFSFTKTNLNSVNPKKLVSSCILNGLVITADGASLRKNYQSSIDNDLVQIVDAPTFGADSGSSGITGNYYYRCTLIDGNNNETGGGDVSAVHAITAQVANPAVDITGFDTAIKGYTKIRWYRSINQTTTPVDPSQLTYYYLTGKDSTIVPATTSYTIADSTDDSDIQLAAQLVNNQPVVLNGQSFFADIVKVFENRLFALGTTENGTYYKNRLRWSDLSDSTETSVGNPFSFHIDDFNDLDSTSGDGLIGMFVFGGRGWVSSGDSMFSVTPTYSTTRGAQFSFAKVTDAVGMYHHTCCDTGSSVVGRTRNGLVLFNGSVPRPIAHEIHHTINRLASPSGDVGVYDFSTKRYYFTCYDPNILCSYVDTGSNQELTRVYRNTLIAYDFSENKVEVYPKVFIQFLAKFEDSQNNERIFYAGNAGDVGMFTIDSILTGPATTFVGTRTGDYTISGLTISSAQNIGKKLHVLAYIDASNQKITFLDYKNDISSINSNVISLDSSNPRIPFFQSSNTLLCAMDSASGTSTTGSTGIDIYDTANYFKAANIDYYGAAQDQGTAGQTYSGIVSGAYFSANGSTRLTFSASTGITAGWKYLIIPFNLSATAAFDNEVPSHKLMTPAYGAQSAVQKKQFHYFLMKCMGSGIVRIRTFLDGKTTSNQTKYVTLSNPTQTKAILVKLNRPTGQYMRVEVTIWRGAGWIRISEASGFFKALGGLRNV